MGPHSDDISRWQIASFLHRIILSYFLSVRLYHIFPHCLTKTAHLPEKCIEQKMCVVIFPNIIL